MGKYDWEAIQKDYDGGFSYSDVSRVYGCSQGAICYAVKQGVLKTRSSKDGLALRDSKHPRPKASPETRKRISEARIKFLKENPDKVPYRINHSSKQSIPEKVFEAALIKHGITGWVHPYQMGIYEYDFAFPELRIDVEVDGATHLSDKVVEIDTRRDEFSREQGWRVLRITASDVLKNTTESINRVLEMLGQPPLPVPEKPAKPVIRCSDCGKVVSYGPRCWGCYHYHSRRVERPSKEDLLRMVQELGYVGTGRRFGVSDNAVRKWVRQLRVVPNALPASTTS